MTISEHITKGQQGLHAVEQSRAIRLRHPSALNTLSCLSFISSAGTTKMVAVLLLLLEPILLHSLEKFGGKGGLQGVMKGGRGDS